MRDLLAAVERAVNRLVRWLIIVLMVFMTVTVSLQIVFRYVFNMPLDWSEEAARFSFVWVSFFGASALMRVREHINVTVFLERFPSRVQGYAVLCANLCALVCIYFFLVGGIALTYHEWRQLAPATEIRMGWVYLVIPLASTLMMVWVLLQTIDSILRIREEGRS